MAFLAVPGLIDVVQAFTIASIGLSLGSVVMGFNSGVNEKLSELQEIDLESAEYAIPSRAILPYRVDMP